MTEDRDDGGVGGEGAKSGIIKILAHQMGLSEVCVYVCVRVLCCAPVSRDRSKRFSICWVGQRENVPICQRPIHLALPRSWQ